jgi:hypothetical protein
MLIPSMLAQAAFQKVLGSNLGRDNDYRELCHDFLQRIRSC